MDKDTLTIRLRDMRNEDGEIDFRALSSLASTLQELATRVARFTTGQLGPGRSTDEADRAARLRLAGLGGGSTTLTVRMGDVGPLDLGVGFEEEVGERFWEVIRGVTTNARPAWVNDLVAESAARVADAFHDVAPRIEVDQPGRSRQIDSRTNSIDAQVWRQAPAVGGERAVVGSLEAVDLRNAHFRVRDDVGNAIGLDEVVDARAAAALVGSRVRASGAAIEDARGRLRLGSARLEAAPLPTEFQRRPKVDLDELVASKPGPDPGGLDDLTDDEWEAFYAAIKGT